MQANGKEGERKQVVGQFCTFKFFVTTLFAILFYAVFCVVFFYQPDIHRVEQKAAVKSYLQRKSCGLQFSSQLSSNPVFKLDPTRFVLPILYNGPTNQLIGLRDTVFLAILLNRTVIIPRFYKHFTDPSKRARQLDERLRIDIERLSNFVSVVPYSAVATACANHFGVAFLGQPRVRKQFKIEAGFLENFNFTLERGLDGEEYNVILDPRDRKAKIKSSDQSVYYRSNATCAMFYYAYRSVAMRERAPLLLQATKGFSALSVERSLNRKRRSLLYAMVYSQVGRPRFVVKICDDFTRDVIGSGGYLAIHWRFDPADWLRKCNGSTFHGLCQKIYHVEGEHIVQAALKQIERLPKDRISPVVYFATPTDNKELMNKVMSAAAEENSSQATSLRFITGLDLKAYLRKYEECHELTGHMEDVLASAEMQICTSASSFMLSEYSSWSSEVFSQRTGKEFAKFDRDILRAAGEFL